MVVEGHPGWASGRLDSGGLDGGPEGTVMEALIGGDGVEGPAAFVGEKEELKGFGEDGTLWWGSYVSIAAIPHYEGAKAQHDGGKEIGEPETNIFLRVSLEVLVCLQGVIRVMYYHSNLANKSTNVDEKVEVVINPTGCDRWINDHALSLFGESNGHLS